jgi:hypothetical protein
MGELLFENFVLIGPSMDEINGKCPIGEGGINEGNLNDSNYGYNSNDGMSMPIASGG